MINKLFPIFSFIVLTFNLFNMFLTLPRTIFHDANIGIFFNTAIFFCFFMILFARPTRLWRRSVPHLYINS